MIRALYTSAAGMNAQQINLDVTSNNLANVNTTGFKKFRTEFHDLHYQMLKQPGAQIANNAQAPEGIQVGMGVTVVGTPRFFNQGDFQHTENPFDIAIQGNGFFKVLLPDGSEGFTRDGSFQVDATGKMVTSDGFFLNPDITVSPEATNVTIGSDGTVSQTINGKTDAVGQIKLFRFINPAGLETIGRNLYRETTASGSVQEGTAGLDGFGTVAQGILEMSNVRVADEMIKMITSMRAYEANSKAVQTADEMLQVANNAKR